MDCLVVLVIIPVFIQNGLLTPLYLFASLSPTIYVVRVPTLAEEPSMRYLSLRHFGLILTVPPIPFPLVSNMTLPFQSIMVLDHAMNTNYHLFGSHSNVSKHASFIAGFVTYQLSTLYHANGQPLV
jgi:hypothetical protein